MPSEETLSEPVSAHFTGQQGPPPLTRHCCSAKSWVASQRSVLTGGGGSQWGQRNDSPCPRGHLCGAEGESQGWGRFCRRRLLDQGNPEGDGPKPEEGTMGLGLMLCVPCPPQPAAP